MDWAPFLTTLAGGVVGGAAAVVASQLATRGQAKIANEEREAEREKARDERRRDDLQEAQSLVALLVSNFARDAAANSLDPAALWDRVKVRQQLRAVLGRVGDDKLTRMVQDLFDLCDQTLWSGATSIVEPEGEADLEVMATYNVGDIVQRIHKRVGELLQRA